MVGEGVHHLTADHLLPVLRNFHPGSGVREAERTYKWARDVVAGEQSNAPFEFLAEVGDCLMRRFHVAEHSPAVAAAEVLPRKMPDNR